MGPKADDYFPEVLARDLDSSTDLFTAKNMTAGSPATVLPVEKTRRKHKSCPTRPSIPVRHHSASARVQSLGAIQERNVIVSFLDQQEHKQSQPQLDYATSDVESNSGTDASGSVAPPSFRYRERSIATAATSVTTTSWKPSPKDSPALDGEHETSWMEIDSDDEEQPEQQPDEIVESPTPRPPTPPDSSTAPRMHPNMEPRGPWSCNNPLHHKSHSVGGPAPIIPPVRRSSKHAPVGDLARSSSTRMKSIDDSRWARSYSPQPPSTPRSRIRVLHSRAGPEDDANTIHNVPAVIEPQALTDDGLGSDNGLENYETTTWNRPNTVYIRPSPPPSPLPSVQAWLNNSVLPYAPGMGKDELSRAVPLPPDVVETLRVSIACFPETMLLSSSLTVETIRTYSRKVRHPNLDLRDLPQHPSPSHSTRKSVWRRVVSYRKGSSHSDSNRPRGSSSSNQGSLPSSASSSSIEAPPPWMPLKHVFGCCSDYICDALYAHILAYNYISALIPRNASPLKPRIGGPNTNDTQSEDIPKKAASLLGLAGAPDGNSLGTHRLARKLSMARLSWVPGKELPSTGGAAQEQTARDIQAGLMRCIGRLVATARLMAESGTGEERMVEMEAKESDVLFTRSLCEIVRISEDAAV